jgi:hypothetical protein
MRFFSALLITFALALPAAAQPTTNFESDHADGLTITDWLTGAAANTNIQDLNSPADLNDEPKFRFLCEASHLGYNDPIVSPNTPGAAHLHQFFGNTLTDYASTYESLRTTGSGSCQGGPLNRSGYWAPAMLKPSTNEVVLPKYIEFYYNTIGRRNLHDDGSGGFTSPACSCGGAGNGRYACSAARDLLACPSYPAAHIPRGLRAIFGLQMSGANAGNFPTTYGVASSFGVVGKNFSWKCITGGSQVDNKGVLWDSATPANGLETCEAGSEIQVRMDTPYCWDGTSDGASNDHYSHLARPQDDGYSSASGVCPATHPYRLPQLTIIIAYTTNGPSDHSLWYLSSDIANGATYKQGESFHTDAFWAWNRSVQLFFHENVNGMHPDAESGAPYTDNAGGTGAVGGTHVLSTSDGGLGNDCTDIGVAGNCSLKGGNLGNGFTVSSTGDAPARVEIPANVTRRGRKSRGRMK